MTTAFPTKECRARTETPTELTEVTVTTFSKMYLLFFAGGAVRISAHYYSITHRLIHDSPDKSHCAVRPVALPAE